MESGTIRVGELSGGLDLQSTVESGQSYVWRREDERMYESPNAHGGSAWYYTVYDREVIRARQRDGRLEWEATTDADPLLRELLRLDDDLDAVREATPADPLVDEAYAAYRGMRIVDDPFFPCLISFICSAQMRVGRIHGMQMALARTFGEEIEFDGAVYHAFPEPARLARATEDELRDLSLGYRAPYVKRSAELLADGEVDVDAIRDLPYEEAREAMQAFVGVGDKVADCVLLFALGHLEAVPLDTWIKTAISDHYPHCEQGSYAATSRAIREQFGPYAGYTQTYVFHHLRNA